MEPKSSKEFCIGVAVKLHLRKDVSEFTALNCFVDAFRITWAEILLASSWRDIELTDLRRDNAIPLDLMK
jgi:hypothetical protein